MLVYWRSPRYNVVRLFYTMLAALILGTQFWGVGSKRDTTQALFTVMGALYSACIFLGVSNASSVQPIVAIERTVFYREKAAGMYSPLAYAAAQQGIISSQLGNVETIIQGQGFQVSVKDYLKANYDYGTNKIGPSIAVLLVFNLLFFSVFAVSVKFINFQRR
ncbi:unnamed protein product [Linum tenue]|uniref:ABC-2 type transporter domain-containing protein n=1 Tax=Linum tenue TaxID=586396 RepID=A0AAV0Q6H9_9ROSI|nr:unnamed protein product [Linum tenue]